MQPLPTIAREQGGTAHRSLGGIPVSPQGGRKERAAVWDKTRAKHDRWESCYDLSDALEPREALKKKVLSEGPSHGDPKGRPHPADDQMATWMRQERLRAEERAERKWKSKFQTWQQEQLVTGLLPAVVLDATGGQMSPKASESLNSPSRLRRAMSDSAAASRFAPLDATVPCSKRELATMLQKVNRELAKEKQTRLHLEKDLRKMTIERDRWQAKAVAREQLLVDGESRLRQILRPADDLSATH